MGENYTIEKYSKGEKCTIEKCIIGEKYSINVKCSRGNGKVSPNLYRVHLTEG